MKNFLKKFRETFLALLPILAIVLFVHFFLYKFDTKVLGAFIISIVLVSIGEVWFLNGVDSTIMPMGELMLNSVNKASKFVIFVVFAVAFGLCATIAEPDVTIFAGQVVQSGIAVSKTLLTFFIGAGVGICIALAIIRIIKNINVKYVYLVVFAMIFLLCTQVKSEYIAIAFDAGGATTGIITAPFLLAISTGITSKFTQNKNNDEVFGMVGMASLGPVLAVLLVFMSAGDGVGTTISIEELNIYLDVLRNAAFAIIPLALVFYLYDLILIKLPARRKLELLIGLVITFVGLYLFLFGIEFGISDMGAQVGQFILSLKTEYVILFCIVLGFVITFCEPSVIVLAKQVESVTKGNISSVLVLISIAIAMAFAILISALKIMFHINFLYIIVIGYIVALLLMFVVPSIFTSLAFDSGGVASGPMTSAFLLPIMIGLASGTANPLDGFGLIGIVSMSPIIVLQILGLVYRIELVLKTKKEHRMALKLTYSSEMYSNIQDLENEYKEMMREKRNER